MPLFIPLIIGVAIIMNNRNIVTYKVIEDDPTIESKILSSRMSGNDLVITYNSHYTPMIIGLDSSRYLVSTDAVRIKDYNNENFKLEFGSTSDIYEFGEGKESTKQTTTYAYDSITTCIGNTCTATIGKYFAYDVDDKWKPVEEAQSLNRSSFYIDYVVKDRVYDAKVIDFNYTSITLIPIILDEEQLTSAEKESGMISVSMLSYNSTKAELSKNEGKDLNDYKNTYSISKENKTSLEDIRNGKEITFSDSETIMGKLFKIGENSTTVTISGSGGVLEDITSWDDTSNNKLFIVKFNVSSIPATSLINSANMSIYLADETGTVDTDSNVWHIPDQTWKESLTEAQLNTILAEKNNATTPTFNATPGDNVWEKLLVKQQVSASINSSYTNCTILVVDADEVPDYTMDENDDDYCLEIGDVGTTNNRATFEDRENSCGNTGKGPQLIVTYTLLDSTPPTYSLNQTNSTLAGTWVNHSLYWTDTTNGDVSAGLSGYIFQFCNGTWNGSMCLGNTSQFQSFNFFSTTTDRGVMYSNALFDQNNDGSKNELFGGTPTVHKFEAYRPNGSLIWATTIPTSIGCYYTYANPKVVDIDGDGYENEIVAGCGYYDKEGGFVIFNETGNMTTFISPRISTCDRINAIAVSDVNGDNAKDVILGCNPNGIYVYTNDGAGHFTNTTYWNETWSGITMDIIIADADCDSDNDIIIADYGVATRAFTMDGTSIWNATTAGYHGQLATGDFNNDGCTEFAANAQNNVFLINKTGGKYLTMTTPGTNVRTDTEAIDFDEDGVMDFVYVDMGGDLFYCWNNGTCPYNYTTLPGTTNNMGVQVVDLDGDNKKEVVITNQTAIVVLNRNASILWSNLTMGIGTIGYSLNYNMLIPGTVFGDVNGDGRMDMCLEGATGFVECFTGNTWTNDTAVAISGTNYLMNVSKLVNSTVGATIAWCVYVNDTSNNWNGTSCANPFSYLTTSSGGEDATFSIAMPDDYTSWTEITGENEATSTYTSVNISCNFTESEQDWVEPYANYDSDYAQSTADLKPIFYIDNTGTGASDFSLRINATLPYGMNITANATCSGTYDSCEATPQNISTTYVTLVTGLSQTNSYANITLYCGESKQVQAGQHGNIRIYINGSLV